ncbi:MAG: PilZ domain-containing protein [Acidiferrobacterales bacterium]
MTTDRRLGPRKKIALEVMVKHRRLGLLSCETRDISLDGAYVETRNLALRKNAKVDLVLMIPAKGKTQQHRIAAKVVSVEKHGVTFIFRNLDETTYSALVDLLYPAK